MYMHDKMLKNGYFDLKMTTFRYHLQNGVKLEFFCNSYPILTSKLLFYSDEIEMKQYFPCAFGTEKWPNFIENARFDRKCAKIG